MTGQDSILRTFAVCIFAAIVLPSCNSRNRDDMATLAKSMSEGGASVGFTDERVFVSFGQTLPTGMPDNVVLFNSTRRGSPSNSRSELREIVSNRPSGQIEVFSSQDSEDVREILGDFPYQEINHPNDWTVFRFGEIKVR